MPKLNAALVYRLIYFIFGLSTLIILTIHVVYRVEVAGLDALQLVLLGTALEVTIFLCEIPTGIVADVYSRRLSAIIGIGLIGAGRAVEGLLPVFLVILVAQIISGVGQTFISGALDAWVTDEVGAEQVGPVLIAGNQMEILGSLLGIPVGVWVSEQIGLQAAYFAAGGLLAALVVALALLMPERGFSAVPPEQRQGWRTLFSTLRAGVQTARLRPALMVFAVIGLFVGLFSEAWDRLAQPYLLETFSFPSLGALELSTIEWFGILNVVFLLVGLLANQIAKHAVDTTHGPAMARGLQWLYAGMVVTLLVYSLTAQFGIALLAMVLFNGLRRVTFPLARTWINQQIDSRSRATVLSLAGQIDALGELSGGPLLGSVGRLYSMRAALVTSALILSPTVPLYQRIIAMTQLKKEEPQ
ncbi:MAG: MFS transporter [Anaerolineales bacterium]|nr:MFS transporter [Anaerolineales bacterium]